LQLYSSNIISTKGIITLVNKVEVRRNRVNEGFLFKKFSMAEEKKGFILYTDVLHTVEKLTDEQAENCLNTF
jgi:hypothetical protein